MQQDQLQEQAGQFQKQLNETKAISFDRQSALEKTIQNLSNDCNALAGIVNDAAVLLEVSDEERYQPNHLIAVLKEKLAEKSKKVK